MEPPVYWRHKKIDTKDIFRPSLFIFHFIFNYHEPMKNFLGLVILVFLSHCLMAQVPVTELYLLDFTIDDTGRYHIHSPRYLSSFNMNGYTNQPMFISDDEVYVSVRKQGEDQHDIYSVHIGNGTVRQVTKTDESEYSPTPMGDGQKFACLRQVTGGEMDQQIFEYPIDQQGFGYPLMSNVKNAGYFAFLPNSNIAMFLLDEPNLLAIGNLQSRQYETISSNVGRCLRTTENGSLVYVHKFSEDYWYLKEYDTTAKRAKIIAETPDGREDFAIAPDGSIVMGDGGDMFILRQGTDEWEFIFDLSIFGINNITRLAINNRNQIVVVNNTSVN